MTYEQDLTKKNIIEILKTAGIKRNSRRLSDYEYSKKLLPQWDDQIVRVVCNFIGV